MYAYSEAASRIFQIMQDDAKINKKKADFSMVIPYMFLVRHTVELALKVAIEGFGKKYQMNHKLSANYTKLQNCSTQTLKSVYPAIYNLVNEFDSIDPDGMYFRYTTDKSGKSILKNTSIQLSTTQKVLNEFVVQYLKFVKVNLPDLLKQ
jgi:hypothetical protein